MIKHKTRYLSVIVLIVSSLILASCVSKKDMLYFQDINKINNDKVKYIANKIQINDILSVKISSLYPEAAIPYNFDNSLTSNTSFIETLKLQGNLVSLNGFITLPVIGRLKASGISTSELETQIKEVLETGNYLKEAIVSVRILNSKITILGEVMKPGTYNITEENVSLLQALGYAGDLTINGNRKDLLIIRNTDGIQFTKHINLTTTDWFDSDYYYVRQNDVIVVNPNTAKIRSSGFFGSAGTVLALTSTLISVLLVLTRK